MPTGTAGSKDCGGTSGSTSGSSSGGTSGNASTNTDLFGGNSSTSGGASSPTSVPAGGAGGTTDSGSGGTSVGANNTGNGGNSTGGFGFGTLYYTWTLLPGSAKDIGVGVDASNNNYAWVIGRNIVNSADFGPHQWNGSTWVGSTGGGVRIAVAPTGVPWIVNRAGSIFRRTTNSATSGEWELMPGAAEDIGIGANGDVWIIGANAFDSSNFRIHKWDSANSTWIGTSDGGATRIAVDSAGKPWIVNSFGAIFRRNSNSATSGTWELLPGLAKDIGIADGNYAWIIGYNGGIFTWSEQDPIDGSPARKEWVQVSDILHAPSQIAVGAFGEPWLVDSVGQIFRGTR